MYVGKIELVKNHFFRENYIGLAKLRYGGFELEEGYYDIRPYYTNKPEFYIIAECLIERAYIQKLWEDKLIKII